MKSLILITISIFLCQGFSLYGQVLQSNQEFSYMATALETNERRDAILSKENYIVLSKIKGSAITPSSDYLLEKYDLTGAKKFSIPLTLPIEEDFKLLVEHQGKIYVFLEVHDVTAKKSACKVLMYQLTDGTFIESKELHQATIQEWMSAMGKGSSKESFENVLSSAGSKNFNTPLEYQYQIEFSPDKQHFILYRYDYSQRTLVVSYSIYSIQLELYDTGQLSIDNYFVNQGIYINDKKDIFIFNAEKSGRIAVIQYNPKTKENIFLDIQSGTSKRESFKFHFLNDYEIYVAAILTLGKKLNGVLYAKFDFQDKLVEKLNIHDVSDGIKQTATTIRQNNKTAGQEDWMNYHISDFYVNPYEKIILVLEKRWVEYTEIPYDPTASNDVKNWGEKLGKVKTESIVALSINSEDKILWENYIYKQQIMDVTAGLNTLSYNFHITVDGKVRFLYAYSNVSTGIMSAVRFVEWNELTGFKIRDTDLPLEESVTLLRNYSTWNDATLLMVAKKGLLGKKSMLSIFSIQSKS